MSWTIVLRHLPLSFFLEGQSADKGICIQNRFIPKDMDLRRIGSTPRSLHYGSYGASNTLLRGHLVSPYMD